MDIGEVGMPATHRIAVTRQHIAAWAELTCDQYRAQVDAAFVATTQFKDVVRGQRRVVLATVGKVGDHVVLDGQAMVKLPASTGRTQRTVHARGGPLAAGPQRPPAAATSAASPARPRRSSPSC